ncbi:peptidase T [Elizabethkingia anophelis]|uniref:peptidase T n=1 Tax=Elizabethkingia anophelis TaxID=1117645 RepID=UPI0021A50DD9|nr:peptidase T [Elizabethkingia anophelis]MCT3806544.1 peptidase T [Elizabethkingia anophelis]MCT3813737.1 peptidase T [Elizabethkingia anophelis]MCT3820831.1 peptidase T [Elizabethkingia anophelis]MCT3835232.1 peptidase T [Elizabethkingia anophelis]MCT3906864.1 peptidase T [Elizabethkingia anophelis]
MNKVELNKEWEEKLLERFLTYVKIYSTSDPESEKTPSTEQQWDMVNYLYEELQKIGLEDVSKDENGYVYGFVPSTLDKEVPQIGFVSHFDSSPDFNGKGIKPIVWENYDGGDLLLNKETGFTLSSTKFKELANYKGKTIITTDGTSLLSADDKAGIAEIVTAAEYLIANPEIKHGRISIGFTPDEEIGRGADKFNVVHFNAEWAYTMDGGEIGELEYENFNASGAVVKIHGLSVHPGYSYGKMVNAGLLAAEFIQSLPANETPATTRSYEGFFHLTDVKADVSEAKLQYIIRDHDDTKYEQRNEFLKQKVAEFNQKHGEGTAEVEIKEQYLNMRKHIEDKMYIIDFAEEAMKISGVTPDIKAIRGGTDGAKLSYMGLPCPNIFAGGHNFHGPYEYVPLQSMSKATEVIIHLVQLVAEK